MNLYHYTSIETLALILKNRTICFNSLINVDDMEESQTEDMPGFGRICYASCWTEDAEESIALWKLYTPDMHGVRISLPRFPFVKYKYRKGDYNFTEDVETFINVERIYNENKVSIVASEPRLIKVIYTEDADDLLPRIRRTSCANALQVYLDAKSMDEAGNLEIQYSLEKIGRYKHKRWSFQNEWRYLLNVAPMGMKEYSIPSFGRQQEFIRRLENLSTYNLDSRIFLDIDQSAFNNMEVLTGPRMNYAEKIIVGALLEKYAPNSRMTNSVLRIR